MTKAADILNTAAGLVSGDRASSHGDKLTNHVCIAEMWNGYLRARQAVGRPAALDAEDVANLMECMKVARRLTGNFNVDDYVDGAGYAAVAGEVRARMNGADASWTQQRTVSRGTKSDSQRVNGVVVHKEKDVQLPCDSQPFTG